MENAEMERSISELITELTLEEKISMIHGAGLFRTAGVARLGIPPVRFSDGPMGVRAEFADAEWRNVGMTDDYVTYLPCNSAVASTWNRELARASGSVLGEEARGRGKDVILAPGINIKRSPLCGRNFEYMSEDPYLIEELVVPMVQGVQQHDVAACVKHFAANSQETQRLWVDTRVDERTLREIYFPGFRAAVEKGGIFSLMGAYNLLNGTHCCASQQLLGGVLRSDWGFDGLIVSDWSAVHETPRAAASPLDVEMGVNTTFNEMYFADPLLKLVRAGKLPESCIDEKVKNILRMMLRLKMIGPHTAERKPGAYNTEEHRRAALQTAEESVILLKNEGHVLPLAPCRTVAVIGANAVTAHADGGGSAEIKALYEITPLMGIKKLLGGNCTVRFAPGYPIPKKGSRPEISWQAESVGDNAEFARVEAADKAPADYIREAVALAKASDAVIFVGGLNHDYDVEGLDRNDMQLPYGQNGVIEALLDARPDTAIVMIAGSPVEMPWLDRANAVMWSYYAGSEGGTALAEALFGHINPSGRLAETFIRSLADCPAKHGENFGLRDAVTYTEGVMVGYRHYDTAGTDVNFCFGHGLSYTEFAYSNLRVAGRNVTLTVKNVGDAAGKETVQLYVAPRCESAIVRPAHQLRGFEKVMLAPGEEAQVHFTLSDMDFSCYDVAAHSFAVIPGAYELQVGASSRDIRLTANLTV